MRDFFLVYIHLIIKIHQILSKEKCAGIILYKFNFYVIKSFGLLLIYEIVWGSHEVAKSIAPRVAR